MNKKMIDEAKALLKAAKENPQQFQTLSKDIKVTPQQGGQKAACATPMKKDDMPHAPNSAPDKAHDVSEANDTIGHALKILDTPEKQKAMLAHLRTLHESSQQRSPANQAAGQPQAEKPMEKNQMIAAAKQLIELQKNQPAKFEELVKAIAPAAPKMAAPKMAAPKMPAAPKMAGKSMTKAEIKEDMAGEWKPRFMKGKK